MTAVLSDAVFIAFTIFCRVGSCLMLVPGYASARVPVQVRLQIAFAVSLALIPLLFESVASAVAPVDMGLRPFLLVNEVISGSAIGLMARLYLLGLQFAATIAANSIGLAGIPGVPIDESEAVPPLATLLSLAGVMVLLAAGLHVEILRALIESYRALPIHLGIDVEWLLDTVIKVVTDSSMMALRLAGPFLVYAVVVNLAMGLANKFTPQVSLFFASLGLVTGAGLLVMFVIVPQWLSVFLDYYNNWLIGHI